MLNNITTTNVTYVQMMSNNATLLGQFHINNTNMSMNSADDALPPILGVPEGGNLENTLGYQIGAALRNIVLGCVDTIKYVGNTVYSLRKYVPNSAINNSIHGNINMALDGGDVKKIEGICHADEVYEYICMNRLKEIMEKPPAEATGDNSYENQLKQVELLRSANIQFPESMRAECFYERLLGDQRFKAFAKEFARLSSNSETTEKFIRIMLNRYDRIQHDILLAKQKSIEENKPLLVLMGETHLMINAQLHKMLAIFIANHQFKIDTLYSEIFSAETLRKNTTPMMGTILSLVENFLKELNMSRVSVDGPVCGAFDVLPTEPICKQFDSEKFLRKYDDVISEKGMKIRNDAMVEEIIKQSAQKDTIALVGADHLYGMLNETNLKEHFTVLALNFSNFSREHLLLYGIASDSDIVDFETIFKINANELSFVPNVHGLYLTLEEFCKIIKKMPEIQEKLMECPADISFDEKLDSTRMARK